jgi:hypothetical protein
MNIIGLRSIVAALALAVLPSGPLQAGNWTNTAGGVFSDAGNWSPSVPPAAGDQVNFTANATYTVSFHANTPLLSRFILLANPADVTFALNGHTLQMSSDYGTGGNNQTNTALFLNGAIAVGDFLAISPGANGLAYTTLSNVTLTARRLLALTAGGAGTMTFRDSTATLSGVSSIIELGRNAGATGTVVLIRSTLDSRLTTGTTDLGFQGFGHILVTNQGAWLARDINLGRGAGTGRLTIHDGLVSASLAVTAGSASGRGSIFIGNGGVLEANSLSAAAGADNTISNVGGVYQFTLASPTLINPNGFGKIALTDGVISFRDVANANVFANQSGSQLINISYAGANAFRLNNSSNTSATAQNYTFDNVLGPTNHARLELVNGGTLWRSATLNIGSGGSLLASNTVGTVAAAVNSSGGIRVANSRLTFASNVVLQGSYVSDPSTNTFLADLTVSSSGSMTGGAGDLFDFKQSFLIHSTNLSFDLASSTVSFSGDNPNHTNAVVGLDFGAGQSPGDKPFAYYSLKLGSATDEIWFTNEVGSVAGTALYTWLLELPDNDTNHIANLHSPFNIYYVTSNAAPQNAYLNDLTYILDGGGQLMPAVPEPSALALLLGAVTMLARRRLFTTR